MSDLISRAAAIDAIMSVDDYTSTFVAYKLGSAITAIKTLPSADAVEVRHGKWVHCDDGSLSWRCSVCGKHAYGNYTEIFSGEYHFCPNCGARMEGEQNED